MCECRHPMQYKLDISSTLERSRIHNIRGHRLGTGSCFHDSPVQTIDFHCTLGSPLPIAPRISSNVSSSHSGKCASRAENYKKNCTCRSLKYLACVAGLTLYLKNHRATALQRKKRLRNYRIDACSRRQILPPTTPGHGTTKKNMTP